ncbi:MAG: DUF4010 domain-containing protein [Bacteroidetes bacterium]|nr:DUF4010 domain-containing protein [Bacteroidota bacterium]
MDYLKNIPQTMIDFLIITVFSLLIGLSQRQLRLQNNPDTPTFGTDRTFTFIGILGYILALLDHSGYRLFILGSAALIVVLAIAYYFHIKNHNDYGLTTIFIALITYSLGPVILTQPKWMVLLIVVTVLIFSELKELFINISQKFDRHEFLTLGKFLIIAGVILPLVPDEAFIPGMSLTPYKIWLAVVVISTISYVSYLLKKFVFRKGGIIISGILGGLYSSTATTIILARKSHDDQAHMKQYMAAIVFAIAMMYLRILLIILIFNYELFLKIWLFLLILALVSAGVALFIFFRNKGQSDVTGGLTEDKNPLEFKVALIFTALYIAFSFITYAVVNRYGAVGLNVLSYIVGLTDIDPFLINLFQGKFSIGLDAVAIATLQAIISNNILKLLYGCFFAGRKSWIILVSGFIIIIAVNIVFVLIA